MNPQNRRAFALLAATNRISSSWNLADTLQLAKTYEDFIAQARVDSRETPAQQASRQLYG